MRPADYLSDLLEALERHTQAVQANTAAVNSLLGKRPPTPEQLDRQHLVSELAADQLERQVITGQLDALDTAADELLTQAQALLDRLELLRQSLTIDKPPTEAPHESRTSSIIPAV